MEKIFRAKLLTKREDNYSLFVFQDLDTLEYVMCTRLPNWNIPKIDVGDIGYVKIQKVKAGESYFHVATQLTNIFNYSNIYLLNFINEINITDTNLIL